MTAVVYFVYRVSAMQANSAWPSVWVGATFTVSAHGHRE